MSIFERIKTALPKSATISFSLPFLNYEVRFDDLISSKSVDDRIARLDQIRTDLNAAVSAVVELKDEALQSKQEAESLRQTVSQLQQDKNTAETLLQVPEESFTRLIGKAHARARLRGILEGLAIGFITGCASSLLVWYITK